MYILLSLLQTEVHMIRSAIYLFVLIFICFGCSRPFTITTSVNNTPWYGTGAVTKIEPEKTPSCPVSRFGISATTDIPYETLQPAKASGCKGDCIPTQHIDFFNIPLAKGKYDLARFDECLHGNQGKVRLAHLKNDPNGPHIIKGTRVNISDDFTMAGTNSWIRITRYNKVSGFVKGKFEVTLMNNHGDTLKLKNGKFQGKL